MGTELDSRKTEGKCRMFQWPTGNGGGKKIKKNKERKKETERIEFGCCVQPTLCCVFTRPNTVKPIEIDSMLNGSAFTGKYVCL
jgi:hypothetical protein